MLDFLPSVPLSIPPPLLRKGLVIENLCPSEGIESGCRSKLKLTKEFLINLTCPQVAMSTISTISSFPQVESISTFDKWTCPQMHGLLL